MNKLCNSIVTTWTVVLHIYMLKNYVTYHNLTANLTIHQSLLGLLSSQLLLHHCHESVLITAKRRKKVLFNTTRFYVFFCLCTACKSSRQFIKTSQELQVNKYMNNFNSILTNKVIQTVIVKEIAQF